MCRCACFCGALPQTGEENGRAGECGAFDGAFADFALIRRWRDTFPTRGKATAVIPQNLEVAFEFLWVDRIFAPSALIRRFAPPSPSKGKAFLAVRSVMWCLLASEIPPADAPPGGGVRLRGAVRLSRSPLHPVCRYDEVICSEMTRWVRRNIVRNLLGWKYSSVKLTDTAFCFSSHAPVTPVSS